MAGSSQHPLQIMENKARFDLNKVLEDWKAELATQPGVSAENIRELETHLLESINAFRKKGCCDEDAYSKARQKLGSVQQLGAEFAKENLLKVWRDRVFWITTFVFFLQLIDWAIYPVSEHLVHPVNATPLGLFRSSIVLAFLYPVPSFLVAIAIGTGFVEIIFRRLHWIFANRWRFAATGVITLLGAVLAANTAPDLRHALPSLVINEFGYLAFAVFIWPRELAVATTARAPWRSSIPLWRDRLFWTVLGLLAIRVWTLVPSIGAVELIRIKGLAAFKHSWYPNVWYGIVFISLLVLPMLVVGLLLSSARLSFLAQWLRTRSRVGIFTGALAVIWVGQVLWLWRSAPTPGYLSTADWNLQIQRQLMCGIIGSVAFIAITLWTMPSRVGPHQEAEDRFRFA